MELVAPDPPLFTASKHIIQRARAEPIIFLERSKAHSCLGNITDTGKIALGIRLATPVLTPDKPGACLMQPTSGLLVYPRKCIISPSELLSALPVWEISVYVLHGL